MESHHSFSFILLLSLVVTKKPYIVFEPDKMLAFVGVFEGMQGDVVRLTTCQIRSAYRRKNSCKRLPSGGGYYFT